METLPQKRSIYQIENSYLELMYQIEDQFGELTDEQNTQLEITKAELENKGVQYAYLMKHIEGDTNTIEVEINRLQKIKKAKDKLYENLKERITKAMTTFGVENIEKSNLKLSLRKSEELIITEGAKIPKKFTKIKIPPPTVDKKLLKDYIKSGKKVKGVSILEKKNLQIR